MRIIGGAVMRPSRKWLKSSTSLRTTIPAIKIPSPDICGKNIKKSRLLSKYWNITMIIGRKTSKPYILRPTASISFAVDNFLARIKILAKWRIVNYTTRKYVAMVPLKYLSSFSNFRHEENSIVYVWMATVNRKKILPLIILSNIHKELWNK